MYSKKYFNSLPKIDCRSEISQAEFLKSYGKPNFPVLFKDLATDWKASKLWTLDYFAQKFGRLDCCPRRSKDGLDFKKFKVASYVRYIRTTKDIDPYYLSNWQFHLDYPELSDHYSVPKYFRSWINQAPPELKKKFPIYSWFFIGPKGSGSILHQDVEYTSAWNIVFSGKKLWLFFPPEEKENLYWGMVDAFNPDIKRFPYFSKIKTAYAAVQGPGDIVFTPTGWWHQVINTSTGISLTENFVNESNAKRQQIALKENGNYDEAQLFAALRS